MQRVTFNIHPLPDDADIIAIADRLGGILMNEDDVETVIFRRHDIHANLREGVCRVDGEAFVEPLHFDGTKPLPDICRFHWQAEESHSWDAAHRASLDALHGAGIDAAIVNTGGGCMALNISTADGTYALIGDNEDGPLSRTPPTVFSGCVYDASEAEPLALGPIPLPVGVDKSDDYGLTSRDVVALAQALIASSATTAGARS